MHNQLLVVALLAGCPGGPKVDTKPVPPPPPKQAPAPPDDQTETEHRWMSSATPDQLKWSPLDPSAGDGGPMVAQVYGEEGAPSGVFIKLPGGSPGSLHTHASDYHGIVVAGTPTNAQDGQKRAAALPPQSYWYQPGGVAHTTSCAKGTDCIIYTHWPLRFDFRPAQAVKGAKVDPRYAEKRAKDVRWMEFDQRGQSAFAPLWGDAQSQPHGVLVKIPPGDEKFWGYHKHDHHGVVLVGTVVNTESGKDAKELPPGSYWHQAGGYKHALTCKSAAPCIAYMHFEGKFEFKPQ